MQPLRSDDFDTERTDEEWVISFFGVVTALIIFVASALTLSA
jgi:hypothetical protein